MKALKWIVETLLGLLLFAGLILIYNLSLTYQAANWIVGILIVYLMFAGVFLVVLIPFAYLYFYLKKRRAKRVQE